MGPSSADAQSPDPDERADIRRHTKRFRFKHKIDDSSGLEQRHGSRRHHHGYHRSKRRKTTPIPLDDPSAYDDSVSGLPPDAAFRESLFDAMGDDEGAAFWEGVYGQPIHDYPNAFTNEDTGEKEQMNDEEYAQYVRRKMWERSWEGIEAAREEKRREREQEKQKTRESSRKESHHEQTSQGPDYLFDLDIEKSLRRGEQRKERKRWKAIWEAYLQRWTDLQNFRDAPKPADDPQETFLRNKIAWPVESGKRKDVSSEEIEHFIARCLEALDEDEKTYKEHLKTERIRWHPDKIQQRYGSMGIDESTIKGVTAVFQTLDRMWAGHRDKYEGMS